MGLGLLILRLAVGLTVAAHGSQKLLGWFDGPGPGRAGKMMETLGFHPGERHARLAGLAEMTGGLLLALGFVTPVAAAIIIGTMYVAGASAHGGKGFFLTKGGYEYTFMLGVASLALAITGPGALAGDDVWPFASRGALYGVLALIVGLGAGSTMLRARQTDESDASGVEGPAPSAPAPVSPATRSSRIDGGRDSLDPARR